MKRQTREQINAVVTPPLRFLALIFKIVYGAFFGWWLDLWLQREETQSLTEDVRAKLPFLFPEGSVVKHPRIRVLPFDYASVEVCWNNLLFSFTRGREDLNVLVAPRHAPKMSYELGRVIAALEGRNYSDRHAIHDLNDTISLLQPHLPPLNAAFSERNFPTIKQKLW